MHGHFSFIFSFLEERTTAINTQRVDRMRNVRVNRSLIDQQSVLSPNVDKQPSSLSLHHMEEKEVVVKLLGTSRLMKFLSPLVSQALQIDTLVLAVLHEEGLLMMVEESVDETIMVLSLLLYLHLQEQVVL